MRVPQDVANPLAIAIRDVLWYKPNVLSFFKDCQLPSALVAEVKDQQRAGTPTIKIVHFVLDKLDMYGDEGWVVAKRILTKMNYWKDTKSIEPDRRAHALESLAAFRSVMKEFEAEPEYLERKEREKREKGMQEERESRGRISQLDHAKLQSFRDEFDSVYVLKDPKERGDRFEVLMNNIFAYYSERSEGPFKRTGEQVDGLFYFDKHWYLVEIRWKSEKSKAADVSVLRDRAARSFGGDTKALFVSFNGFSKECLESMAGGDYERVILFDGSDLRCVLDCQIGFDVLLAEKQIELVRNKRPWVSAVEIIKRRAGN
ncbi:MAG: hypothetical protein DMG88_22965 [Acidobacteria bacterium]|nr:MAG: hypothetical protein DMG88_22965 [Acidobacteriota bacterium]